MFILLKIEYNKKNIFLLLFINENTVQLPWCTDHEMNMNSAPGAKKKKKKPKNTAVWKRIRYPNVLLNNVTKRTLLIAIVQWSCSYDFLFPWLCSPEGVKLVELQSFYAISFNKSTKLSWQRRLLTCCGALGMLAM